MNISWSYRLLEELYLTGVREIVFCAGARNSPLVMALTRAPCFVRHSFFEERSGAFFALGISRRTGQAVAMITTSGTAVTELLSTAAEAFHTGVPLIFVTADRPRRLRGTGAPQAIDQVGLFTKFTSLEFDLAQGEMFNLAAWSRRAPVHVNVCFDEPLIDEPLEAREPLTPPPTPTPQTNFAGLSGFERSSGAEWAALRLTKFLRQSTGGGLVSVVGTLETDAEREAVTEFLLRVGAPVYLEATSGLRERPQLRHLQLRSGDKILSWAVKRNLLTHVLRIGGVPTVRIWRDLDEANSAIEVLSLTPLPFAGLSRGELICSEISSVVSSVVTSVVMSAVAPAVMPGVTSVDALYAKDRAVGANLLTLFEGEPFSEPALVRALSRRIPENSLVYVGNSLPIREWDLAATTERVHAIEANRGVNGIDGQLASFLGLARAGAVENWAIVGDLTALYDLAAPWALIQARPELLVRLVVINNGGGKIFSRIFKNDLFENRHHLNFEHWARMWNLEYVRWQEVPSVHLASQNLAQHQVIELVPDETSTRFFWDRYDALWD
jgi:2-succinyl-5-enolpyruvyl-6-hydroxy-3-cyclohexene-1-carboxylate synthase